MKRADDHSHKERKFLKLPSYPGGKQAFIKFVEENLVYPEPALKNRVEGTVYVEYTVDNIGTVADERVIHGIGYGCDEEAVRIIRMLKYHPKKNRGVRMKTLMKSRIRFELPAQVKQEPTVQVTYMQQATSKPAEPVVGKQPESYTYTIRIGNQED